MSETYLDSYKIFDNDNFNLPDHNIVRVEHPSNTQKGGVCIYFSKLPFFKGSWCSVLARMYELWKKIYISFYRSPSQSRDEFESFADNLDHNLNSFALRNTYLVVVLGDFNAQTKGWYPSGKTSTKALELMILRLNWDWNNWFIKQPKLSIIIINPYYYVDHIRNAINGFQWEKSFQNMNVTNVVHLFNRNIKIPEFYSAWNNTMWWQRSTLDR